MDDSELDISRYAVVSQIGEGGRQNIVVRKVSFPGFLKLFAGVSEIF